MSTHTIRALTCQEIVELVTDYVEGALDRRTRSRFERHISGCPHCTAYLEQIRETVRLTGMLREDQLEPRAREELLAAFRTWKAAPEG
jgi:anti-sigma factor RsiW